MELIERYVYAVTSKLPENQREDIGREIRTLIDDMMEEYPGTSETEKVERVLSALGDPRVLAENYMSKKRYLIGPDNFYNYLFTLKIVLIAVFVGISIATVLQFAFVSDKSGVEMIGSYIGTVISALLQAFTWVTVIFAIIEYKGINLREEVKSNKEWSVNQLPTIPNKKQIIPRVNSIISIVFITVFAIVLYLAPESMAGYFRQSDGNFVKVPIFNMDIIEHYKFLIVGVFVLSILKEIVKIIYGRWSLKVSIIYSVLTLISLILVIIFFSDSAIWNPTLISDASKYIQIDINLTDLKDNIINGLLTLIIVVNLIDIASALYRGIKYDVNREKTIAKQ